MKGFGWKLILVVAVILTATLCVIPSIFPDLWPHKKIKLGLDLQGGMHIVLNVDTDKAVETALEQVCIDIRSCTRKRQINVLSIKSTSDKKLQAILKNKANTQKFNALLHDEFPELKTSEYKVVDNGFFQIFLEFPKNEVEKIRKLATAQALETIRNRIDQFGVSDPEIRIQGLNHILVQLPGIKNTQRAKELIGRTAMLEFRIVTRIGNFEKQPNEIIPPGNVVMYKQVTNKLSKNKDKIPILVKRKAPITGAHLIDARVNIDSRDNTPHVMIKLNKIGTKIFEQLTSENLNKQLAIVLDGNIYSTPTINDVISGGQAIITGGFTIDKARDLAIVLRAGSLPAPVKIVEERTVGPSLGTDSIKTGFLSMCIGSFAVILFMFIYYKTAGLIANLALIVNALLISAGLAVFQSTLTLPGIAGIILTIGMAVDANVLIFERIREELRLGRFPIAAVNAGYNRATLTIMDANLTTLIASLVLFQFGTGPIKGFAITLSIGVLASLFTSLILTRAVFDYLLIHRKSKNISI